MSRIALKLQAKIRLSAGNRCGYCRLPQAILMGKLEIEHLLPIAEGGTDAEENLWLASRDCNSFKSSKVYVFDEETAQTVRLFSLRFQNWHEHFKLSEDKISIIGTTIYGRATVAALQMNTEQALIARKLWVEAGWYPPKD